MTVTDKLTSVKMWTVSGPFKEHGTMGSMVRAISVACTEHSNPMICRSAGSFAPTAVLGLSVCWYLFSSGDRGVAIFSASGPVKGEEQQQTVVENCCSWKLQDHSLQRVGRPETFDESYFTKSLEVYWRDVVEASYKYSRTVQSSGRKARRRAHHPWEPQALIASMTKTLSTFTGISDGPIESIVKRQPGQLLNSSLLKYTNLSSLEHQGDGSVLHLDGSMRFLFDQWRCGSELLVRINAHRTAERLKQGSLELITSVRRSMGLGPEYEETCDHELAGRSLGGSVSLGECHTALSEEWLYIQWPDQATGTWACDPSRTGCRSFSSGTPWMPPARTETQARVVKAILTAPVSDIWQYFPEILDNTSIWHAGYKNKIWLRLGGSTMVMKASRERLLGHDGDNEPQGRPMSRKVELASMSAPVVLHNEGVRNHTCMSLKCGLQEVPKRRNVG